MALTARISSVSNEIICELVAETGRSKTEIIQSALEAYRHQERMRLLNESFAELKSNKETWIQELEERNELEGTLSDGLE